MPPAARVSRVHGPRVERGGVVLLGGVEADAPVGRHPRPVLHRAVRVARHLGLAVDGAVERRRAARQGRGRSRRRGGAPGAVAAGPDVRALLVGLLNRRGRQGRELQDLHAHLPIGRRLIREVLERVECWFFFHLLVEAFKFEKSPYSLSSTKTRITFYRRINQANDANIITMITEEYFNLSLTIHEY